MTDDAVIVLCVGSVAWLAGLLAFLEWRTRQLIIDRVGRQWARAGRDIHYWPVATTYYGSEPRQSHANVSGKWAVMGLADRQLMFVERASRLSESAIDFETIRWVGVRKIAVRSYTVQKQKITVQSGKYTVQKPALIVHYEAVDSWTKRRRWYAAAFQTDQCHVVANVLSQQTGLAFHDLGTAREDHGPADATRMLQDIYGQWHPVLPDDYQGELDLAPGQAVNIVRPLYLAPDRLLFDWEFQVHFAQMRGVDVYEKGTLLHELNPLSRDLLRIDFAAADGTTQVVGFHMMFARKWGETIAERAGVPLTVHEGRKKKGA